MFAVGAGECVPDEGVPGVKDIVASACDGMEESEEGPDWLSEALASVF